MMASSGPSSAEGKSVAVDAAVTRKPRILLAACGSTAAVKFPILCHTFSDWAEVRAVVTTTASRFIDKNTIPNNVVAFCDEHEWICWNKIGDNLLHIELSTWADIMVIAPLSANTLAKIAGGLCDNLLTCIVRAWDYSKPMFVAPSMNKFMWRNPFTEKHFMCIEELGVSLIPPVTTRSASGDHDTGAMADPTTIYSTVRFFFERQILKKKPGMV